MKSILRAGLIFSLLLFAWLPKAVAQPRVAKINVEHIGPPATSDSLIRANIRSKVGEPYSPLTLDDDVKNLYGTGFFFNIRTAADDTPEGVVLTYIVQGKPL